MLVVAAIIVVATLVAMASGKVPAVLALATAIAFAGVTGIAPVSELASGLSNGGVITVAGMLVIAKGVVHTGVVTPGHLAAAQTVDTATAGVRAARGPDRSALGADQHHADRRDAHPRCPRARSRRATIPAREVLLPITHATTLAGSVTLIGTSSNLIIAGLAAPLGVEMTMLSFAPVALPVALVGWARAGVHRPPAAARAPGDRAQRSWTGGWSCPSRAARTPSAARPRPSAWTAPRSTTCRRSSAGERDLGARAHRSRPGTSWCTRRPSVGCAHCGGARASAWRRRSSTWRRSREGDFGMLSDLELEGDTRGGRRADRPRRSERRRRCPGPRAS